MDHAGIYLGRSEPDSDLGGASVPVRRGRLFAPVQNEAESFSAEKHTSDLYLWTGYEAQNPWEWRILCARSGRVAYFLSLTKSKALVHQQIQKNFSEASALDAVLGWTRL